MASLQHVRRLVDLLHKYMADPKHLDAYAEEMAGVSNGGIAAAAGGGGGAL